MLNRSKHREDGADRLVVASERAAIGPQTSRDPRSPSRGRMRTDALAAVLVESEQRRMATVKRSNSAAQTVVAACPMQH